MALKKVQWNEGIFFHLFHFASDKEIVEKLKSSETENITRIELNKSYSLHKDLFGVKIEYGTIVIQKISIRDAMELLNSFVEIYNEKKDYEFKALSNFEGVVKLAEKYRLEKPDREVIDGYIMNDEFVRFVTDESYYYLQFKYKDSPENIFYIYKFYFTMIHKIVYMVIEKNI